MDGVAILALAGVTYISSSGVIARLLEDLHRLGNRETPAVLSVLVLEDFAMAAYLPLFAVLASGGNWLEAVAGMLVAGRRSAGGVYRVVSLGPSCGSAGGASRLRAAVAEGPRESP